MSVVWSQLRRRWLGAVVVSMMACAEGCATGVSVQRRCKSPLSNEVVVLVTDRDGTRVPEAKVAIVSRETGQKWYLDTDQNGTVRLNLVAGRYLIWGEFDRLRRGVSPFEVRAGCDTFITVELELVPFEPGAH